MSNTETEKLPAQSDPGSGMKRQFAWSVAPLVVTTFLNLFSVRFNIRFLGDELYALLGFVATFSGMFGFADMGLGVAVGRYIGIALGRGDKVAVREYWGTGNLIALPLLALAGISFSGLGLAFGPHWCSVAAENRNMLRACFAVGGLSLFLNYYSQFWLILSQAHLDFKFIGILRTAMSLLQIIPALVLAWLTRNPFLILCWSAAVGMAQLIIFFWHSRRNFNIGIELRFARRARAREMASYTGKTFAGLLIGNVFGSVDRILLGRLTPKNGTDFVNYTNAAANVGSRLQNVGGAIMGPVFHNTTRALGGGRNTAPATIYNETFDFVFNWYLLAAVWCAVWHPVLLRAWLGAERGMQVEPIFTPVIVGFCLTALSGIASAQLGAMNRIGTALGFTIVSGTLAGIGAFVGWQTAGVVGVAYGFLCSRVALLAQDLFTIRLIKAGGWLRAKTWKSAGAQVLVGGVFASIYFYAPRTSLWLLVPAALHGGVVSAWLARHYVRKFIGQ